MRIRSLIGNVVLVSLAVALGWWVRGSDKAVLAQKSSSASYSSSSSSSNDLGFQMSGIGPDATLTLFNPKDRTLYVYTRVGGGGSTINCTYSFKIFNPGAPLQRENCPVGELLPQR